MLTGCFGDTETVEDEEIEPGKISYETSNFKINMPEDWEIIERQDFTSNVPIETVVGFRSNIKSEIFTSNVNISESQLPVEINSKDFAKSSISSAKNKLTSYKQINFQDYELEYKDESIPTYIIEFSGKQSPIEPIVQFKQIFISHNGIGYTITGSFLSDESESIVKQIDEMLDSFSLM